MCTPLLYITILLTLTSPTRVRITSFFSVGMRLCSVEIPNLFSIKITVQKKTEDTINRIHFNYSLKQSNWINYINHIIIHLFRYQMQSNKHFLSSFFLEFKEKKRNKRNDKEEETIPIVTEWRTEKKRENNFSVFYHYWYL